MIIHLFVECATKKYYLTCGAFIQSQQIVTKFVQMAFFHVLAIGADTTPFKPWQVAIVLPLFFSCCCWIMFFENLKLVKGYTFCEWIALNMSQIKNHTCFALKLNILFGFQFFISNSMNYARLMRIVSLFCLIDLRIPDESRNGLHSSRLGSERSHVKRIESSQHLCGLTL